MMDAEEDIDFNDEFGSLSLQKAQSDQSPHQMSNPNDRENQRNLVNSEFRSCRSLSPIQQNILSPMSHFSMSLNDSDINFASKRKDQDKSSTEVEEDKKRIPEGKSDVLVSGSHTPVQLTAPGTPEKQDSNTSSSLFENSDDANDFLNTPTVNTSKQRTNENLKNSSISPDFNNASIDILNKLPSLQGNKYLKNLEGNNSHHANTNRNGQGESYISQTNSITHSPIHNFDTKEHQLNPSAQSHVLYNTTSPITSISSKNRYQSPYQATNILNANPKYSEQQAHTTSTNTLYPSQQTSSGLFIPSMYNSSTNTELKDTSTSKFFTPVSQQSDSTFPPVSSSYNSRQQSTSNVAGEGGFAVPASASVYNNQMTTSFANQASYYEQSSQSNNFQAHNEQGLWNWIKSNVVNKDWSEGAQTIKKQMKNAADSVLTTLDPGMENYLRPSLNVGVLSHEYAVLVGVKAGFSNESSSANIKGQRVSESNPFLPIGFQAALQCVASDLEHSCSVNFGFNETFLVLSVKPFLIELISGSWFAMLCVGLKDVQRNVTLHSFSQPIAFPVECITHAYNRSLQMGRTEFVGYDISIEEAVKLHIPFTRDQDWSLVLGGIRLQDLVSNTIRSLSYEYKRLIESQSNQYLQPNQTSGFAGGYVGNAAENFQPSGFAGGNVTENFVSKPNPTTPYQNYSSTGDTSISFNGL